MATRGRPRKQQVEGGNGAEQTRAMDIHDTGKGEASSGVGKPPVTVEVVVEGVAPILFHRWDCAEVKAKGEAKKNSEEKKTDNLESYVYRTPEGMMGIPADVFRGALVGAAKSQQDPRSPRKSARDLVNAVVLVEPVVAPLMRQDNGTSKVVKTWDYEDRQRVTIQRNGVTRVRPALREGWRVKFLVTSLDTSYVGEAFLHNLVDAAGRYCGLCDHRPQYGRFKIVSAKRVTA